MADDPIQVTVADTREPQLLGRLLRRITNTIHTLDTKIEDVEARKSLTLGQIKQSLEAKGSNPLNITNLDGKTRQPQLAATPRLASDPTDQVLQQYHDTQLLLIGSASTGFALKSVIAGNPNTLYTLVQGLSSSAIMSTSTNLMTLDTVQTSTGNKTLQGVWSFSTQIFGGAGSAAAPEYAFSTSTQSGVFSPALNQLGLAAAGTEVVHLSSDNKVGIRQTSPSYPLDVGDVNNASWAAHISNLNAAGHGLFIDAAADNAHYNLYLRSNAFANLFLVRGDGAAEFGGKVTSYNGIATTGNGVPSILYRYTLTGVSTAAAVTTMYTTTSTGEYRISYYVEQNTTGTLAGIAAAFQWTDDYQTRTQSSNAITTTSTSPNNIAQGVFIVRAASGTNINASSFVGTSTVAPLGTYSIYAVLEKLT